MKIIKNSKDITTLEVGDVVVFGDLEYEVSRGYGYFLNLSNYRNDRIFIDLNISKRDFIENLGIDAIKIFQKYFQVDWKFAKQNYIYYIDPESDMTMCQPLFITFDQSINYKFKRITLNTVQEYVDRLQKPKADLNRGDQQPTSGIQCTSSKITIASGHLEDRTIDFRRRNKAQIGKANLSF